MVVETGDKIYVVQSVIGIVLVSYFVSLARRARRIDR